MRRSLHDDFGNSEELKQQQKGCSRRSSDSGTEIRKRQETLKNLLNETYEYCKGELVTHDSVMETLSIDSSEKRASVRVTNAVVEAFPNVEVK